ncbi:MAG: hypothetical protein PUC32_03120 [Oscillospiraceae bacterium]|nr:hypothetical protein [Oscillospiraceae bacterium]
MNNEELVRMSESLKSAHKRISNLESKVEDLHALTVAVATVNTKVDNLGSSVDEIKTEVKKVTERPGKWWDKLLAALLGAVGTGIAGAVLAQILK